jgi:cell division protein FtsN
VIEVTNEGKEKREGRAHCGSEECGFTIFLEEREIFSFMDLGDYSSARELEHFKEVSAQLEKRLREGEGLSLLALSASENRLSRDFAVLQIAHLLGKHGRKVLVVDCDFLDPGLSGIVENAEELGFLDFLLYGSSLQSIGHSVGIDGVTVVGPGSFPVSKTVPFAHKEFRKVNEFLATKNDVVIYCSTLFTDDGKVNPMIRITHGVLLCCRIDEMEEGQLKKNLEELNELDTTVDVICFSTGGEVAAVAGAAAEKPERRTGEAAEEGEETAESVYIEKMGEIEMEEKADMGRINIPRIVTIAAAVIIVSFVVWWVLTTRTIQEQESSSRMTELVRKQRDAREAGEKRPVPDTMTARAADEGGEDAVAEEPLAPAAEPMAADETPAIARFTVHVASFRSMQRAEAEAGFLESQGYDVEIVETQIRGVTWLRVMAGRYATEEDAREARAGLLSLKRITYAEIVELDAK